jgi:hypothetical protein
MAASASASSGEAAPRYKGYGVLPGSMHFAEDYNACPSRGTTANTGSYLAVGSINIGGARKSSWKNEAIMEDTKALKCAIVTFAEYDSKISLEGHTGWHCEPLRITSGEPAVWQSGANAESSLGMCYNTDVVASHTVHNCFMVCHNPDAEDKNKVYSPVAVVEFTLSTPRCNSNSLTILLTHFHHSMAKKTSKARSFAECLVRLSLQYKIDQWHGDYNSFAYTMTETVTTIFKERRTQDPESVSHISQGADSGGTWSDTLWLRFASKVENDCVLIACIAGSPFFNARWKPVEPHQDAMQELFKSGDQTSHLHAFSTLHGKPKRSPDGKEKQRSAKRARKQH